MPIATLRSAVDRAVAGGQQALLLVDVGVAVLLCGGLLFANTRDIAESVGPALSAVRIAGTVIATASVAVRRLSPRCALPVATLSAATVGALGGAPMISVCIAITAYTAATADRFRLWWAPPAVAGTVIAAAVAVGQVESWFAAAIASVAVVSVGWFAGQAARERQRRLVAASEQRAESERRHTAELRQAVVDERLVIARELHDIVAHSMSVIAVRAGVARMVMDDDPGEVRETLGIIETNSRQALHEMRLLVEVLRQEDPDGAALAPTPGLADIVTLADQIRLAGVDLDVDISGPVRPLPPGVDLSAYRIVQEALTNVVRHAGRTRATLRIDYRPAHVSIDVTDAGRADRTAVVGTAPRTRAGHGLIGMRERVALFDGELRTGHDGVGFHVNAVLRTEESTP